MFRDLRIAIERGTGVVEIDLAGLLETVVIRVAQFVDRSRVFVLLVTLEKGLEAGVAVHLFIILCGCSACFKVIEIVE